MKTFSPYVSDSGVEIVLTPTGVRLITPDKELSVWYDGNHHATVTVSSDYADQVM